MPPPSIHSNEYTPTTPLSNIPDDNVNPETVTNPVEVPVPGDSSDDDLVMEDAWICQNDKVIRVHHRPRTAAFDPSTCSDCPVDLLSICGERTTSGNSQGKSIWTYRRSVGCGVITNGRQSKHGLESQFLLSSKRKLLNHALEEDIMHVEEGQVFECEIFLSESECQKICEDPHQFPVLAAAAAKRQRTEVKLRDLSLSEQADFQKAKEKEISQWLDTETVRKILEVQNSQTRTFFDAGGYLHGRI